MLVTNYNFITRTSGSTPSTVPWGHQTKPFFVLEVQPSTRTLCSGSQPGSNPLMHECYIDRRPKLASLSNNF